MDWEQEKLNIKFCKYILRVSKLSTNIAVLSELGRFPLYIDIITRMFMYWYRLEHSPSDLLNCSYNEYKSTNPGKENSWYSNILFFSNILGLDLAICKNISKGKFKALLKKCIKRNFLNTWSEIKNTYQQDQGKLNVYFKFKSNFQCESYLDLKKYEKRQILSKFRISNHCLRIETGRHERKTGINGKNETLPRGERICKYCSLDRVEDEIHFLFECPLYSASRIDFLQFINSKYPNIQMLNNQHKLIWLMINEDRDILHRLIEFIKNSYNLRKDSNTS